MTKKELKELIKEVISEETQSVDPEEILGKILELTISDTSDPLLILMKIRALAKNYFDKVGYKVNEAGGYEEAISESMSFEQLKNLGFIKTNDDDDYTIFKKDDSVITFNKQTGKYTLEDVSDRNIRTYVRNGTIKDVLEYL